MEMKSQHEGYILVLASDEVCKRVSFLQMYCHFKNIFFYFFCFITVISSINSIIIIINSISSESMKSQAIFFSADGSPPRHAFGHTLIYCWLSFELHR